MLLFWAPLPFLEHHVVGIVGDAAFPDWLLSRTNMHSDSSASFLGSIFSLVPSSILLSVVPQLTSSPAEGPLVCISVLAAVNKTAVNTVCRVWVNPWDCDGRVVL